MRITPACAGKRVMCALNTSPVTDHPRVCGEKQLGYDGTLEDVGSPPRVRGKD